MNALGGGAPVLLETGGTEQFKHASTPGLDGCIRGAVFRRYVPERWDWDAVRRGEHAVKRADGYYETVPFRCGSWNCPGCAADRAREVRAGIREAVQVHGLRELITLTLQDQDEGMDPLESRTKISRMWNAFATRLRRTAICAVSSCRTVWSMGRGRDNCPTCGSPIFVRFLTEYVAVDEEHKSGNAHKHVAANVDGLLMSVRNDYAAAQAVLSEAWGRLGGGFVDFHAGRDRANASGYLTKYIAKAQVHTPRWAELRWCTEDNSFRTRPWHRFSASRLAGRTIASLDLPIGDGVSRIFPWKLCREEPRPGGRMVYPPWNPAVGSAIVDECGGHAPVPEWAPGSCHHGGGPMASLGQCFCVPPWAYEPSWVEPTIADESDVPYIPADVLEDAADNPAYDPVIRDAARILLERRELRERGLGPGSLRWWGA